MSSNGLDCVHHWLIETPQPGKETVTGDCKYCGKRRDFESHPTVLLNRLFFEERGTERMLAAQRI